jgi:hypothetical protein
MLKIKRIYEQLFYYMPKKISRQKRQGFWSFSRTENCSQPTRTLTDRSKQSNPKNFTLSLLGLDPSHSRPVPPRGTMVNSLWAAFVKKF